MIILPRIVPQVHRLEPARVTPEDSIAWEVPQLAALVDNFCKVTGATTLPSLHEWTVLPDKVCAALDISFYPMYRRHLFVQGIDAEVYAQDANVICAFLCPQHASLGGPQHLKSNRQEISTGLGLSLAIACHLQRRLHAMYQSYFEADPAHRAPPIPTVFLTPPGTKEG